MALAFYFAPASMSATQYDQCIKLLRKAGAGHPRGRVYHACFGDPSKLAVFDVWTSQAAFDAFGKTLMPILQQIGVAGTPPVLMPVQNTIVQPAKKAAAKRPAAKRAAVPKKKAKAGIRRR